MSSTADQLFARARALAEAAADLALAANALAGADATEVAADRYFGASEPELKAFVAALPDAGRAELGPPDELWELLANEWFEAWEERTARR